MSSQLQKYKCNYLVERFYFPLGNFTIHFEESEKELNYFNSVQQEKDHVHHVFRFSLVSSKKLTYFFSSHGMNFGPSINTVVNPKPDLK